MNTGSMAWRRNLSRKITECLEASPAEILSQPLDHPLEEIHRIGFTGPPGAGKSSLIARWSEIRVQAGRRVGVIAVDPSSPISGGSLLGDRIRMERVGQAANFFFRSIPSGGSHDGLCRNACGVLEVVERNGFQDVVLETVGIGQGEYAARRLVDTLVVVLMPESGDTIQAMKAGLMEVADIYVINKSDLKGTDRLHRELDSMLKLRTWQRSGWVPPIITVTERGEIAGHADLDLALKAHEGYQSERVNRDDKRRQRARLRIAEVFAAELNRLLDCDEIDLTFDDLLADYLMILGRMRDLA